MKKLLSIFLVAMMLMGLTAAMAEEPIKLVYAEVNPLDTIVGQTGVAFKEKLEELSKGQIVLDIQASGVLGSEAQILDGILSGGDTVDISRISAFALTSYGNNKAKLLSIPYTFVSREHYWNFVNSDLAAEFLAEPQQNGLPLRGLFYGEEGFRHFFLKKEVKDIEGLKNMKIRVSDDPVMRGMVENLGANPTIVSFPELYSALQSGVVDAAEQPIANYRSNAFPEVAPYLLLDGHTLGAIQVVITDKAWAKLNEEQQGWVMEAAKYAGETNAKLSAEKEAEVLEQLKKEGVTVIEVEDKTPWVEACQKTIIENTKDQAELYQKLLDLK